MQIINPQVQTYSDGQIAKALERELRTGLQLKKAWEQKREIEAAHEAKQLKGQKAVAGLGNHVATMPAWEFFRLRQKYGHEEIHSDEFLKNYQKRFPHLAGIKL
jgi:hypothetical protein